VGQAILSPALRAATRGSGYKKRRHIMERLLSSPTREGGALCSRQSGDASSFRRSVYSTYGQSAERQTGLRPRPCDIQTGKRRRYRCPIDSTQVRSTTIGIADHQKESSRRSRLGTAGGQGAVVRRDRQRARVSSPADFRGRRYCGRHFSLPHRAVRANCSPSSSMRGSTRHFHRVAESPVPNRRQSRKAYLFLRNRRSPSPPTSRPRNPAHHCLSARVAR
jgi:hypothetical protein